MMSLVNEDIFIDATSKRQFRRFKYFDHDVIQDVETGRINAGKFVKDTSRINGKRKDIEAFKHIDDYRVAIEITRDIALQENLEASTDINSEVFIVYNEGYGDDVKGSYAVFEVFQLVALWADKKHKVEVLKLIKVINEAANALNVSAYEVMNKTIEDLKQQIETKDKRILSLETNIKKLTTPHNKLFDSCLYGRIYGDYIHIKYRKEVIAPSVDIDRIVPMINANDVLLDFKFYAKKLHLLQSVNSKWMIKLADKEKAYKMIDDIKDNVFDIYAYSDTNELIDEELAKLKALNTTSQRTGKII